MANIFDRIELEAKPKAQAKSATRNIFDVITAPQETPPSEIPKPKPPPELKIGLAPSHKQKPLEPLKVEPTPVEKIKAAGKRAKQAPEGESDFERKVNLVTSSLNRGLAGVAGAPVDLATAALKYDPITAGINKLRQAAGFEPIPNPFQELEEPVGGSAFFNRLMPGEKPEPETPTERVIAAAAEETGANIIPSAGIIGLAGRQVPRIPRAMSVSKQVAQQFLKRIMGTPEQAVASELGAAAGTAAATAGAEILDPGDPLSRALAAIGGAAAGGIGGALALSLKAPKPKISPAKAEPVAQNIFDALDTDQGLIGKTVTKGLEGRQATLKTVTNEYPVKYKVVEVDELKPSHDPVSFAENPKYPKGVQERDYLRDKDAQAAVIRNAQRYDPSFTITDAPGPEHGPPIVTPDGIVLGGNSRTMSTARLYEAGQGDIYKKALAREADRYGINPKEIEGVKQPVLVRELQKPPTNTTELSVLGSDLNKVFTRGLSEQEAGVSAGRRITQETLDFIGGELNNVGENASIRDLLRARPKQILDKLTQDNIISPQELRKYIDERTGALNEAGRDFFENAILGTVIDDAHLLASAPKGIVNKVARALGPLARLKARGETWDITENVKEALRAYTAAAARGESVDEYLDPRVMKMFGEDRPMDPVTIGIVNKLKQNSKEVKKAFAGLADDATADVKNQAALGFFEKPTPEESLKQWFNVDVPKEAVAKGAAKGSAGSRVSKFGEFQEFDDLASAQRGAPESAMLDVQGAYGGGVFNPVVEHTGDLIHRMSEMAKYGNFGRGLVRDKIDKVLTYLEQPYGFRREMMENLQNNYRYAVKNDWKYHSDIPVEARKSVDAFIDHVKALSKKYAEEHRKLTPFNRPQKLANDAAIAVGEWRFEDAIQSLKQLQKLTDDPDLYKKSAGLLPSKKLAKGSAGARVSKFGEIPPRKPPEVEAKIPGSAKVPEPNAPVLAEVERITGAHGKPPEKKFVEKLRAVPTKAQSIFTSEFTPLRELERKLYKKAGELLPRLDMARKFEQVAGAAGKAEADIIRFKSRVLTRSVLNNMDDFNSYLFLRRVVDRLTVDAQRKKVANWTIEKAEAGLRELQEKLGSDTFAKFDEAGQVYQEEMDKALRLQVDSGRMSNEVYQAIKKDNDFYAPFKLLKYLEEGEALSGAGRKIATTADLTKRIVGIEAEDFALNDFLQESVKQIYRSRILAEKNLKMLELDELAHLDPDGILMKKLRPTRYYQIHYKPAEEILHQLAMQKTARNPQFLEVSLVKVGKAIKFAEQVGLRVNKKNMLTALGRANLGGADFRGNVTLNAFTSETIAHELAHAFDTPIVDASGNIVRKVKKVFGEDKAVIQRLSSAINDREIHQAITGKKLRVGKRSVFQQELLAVTDYTGLGGSASYRAKAVERFAEFVQLYIHDPKQARALAPEFTGYFERTILPHNKIKNLVEKLAKFYQKVDGLDNVYTPLKEMDNHNYLELAIRKAFPEDQPRLGVIFGEKARPGYEIVNYYKDGKIQALEVEKDVAKAIQGLTPAAATQMAKVMQMTAQPLRMGATAFNVAFQPVNLFFADLPRAALISRYGVKEAKDLVKFPGDWIYSAYSAIKGNFGKPNQLYKQFLDSGAANSTIQREITPQAFNPQVVGARSRAGKIKAGVLNSLPRVANAIEETSKILGIKRAWDIEGIAKMGPEQAAAKIQEIVTEVRNYSGSPDFLRRGQASAGRDVGNLNLLFMFFNARIQGAASDLARLAGKTGKGEGKKAWMRLSAAVGLPAWTLAMHNRSSEEIVIDGPQGPIKTTNADDYAKVPEWEQDNYFMIPRDQYFVNDQGETVRDYYKIPKREIVKLFGNLMESAVNFAYDREPEAAAEYAAEFLENIAPISIEGETASERVESAVSSLNPILKAPIEYGLGRDTFRHRDVVPQYIEGVPSKQLSPEEQYTEATHPIFKAIGKTTGTAPVKVEQMVRGLTAGGVTQLFPRQGRSKLLSAPLTGAVGRRFVRSDFTNRSEEIQQVQDALVAQGDKKVQMHRKAEELWETWKELPPEKRFQKFQQTKKLNPALSRRIKNIAEDEKLGLSYTERLMRQLEVGTGERARYITAELEKLEDPEQKFEYFQDLKQKGLISDRVRWQIKVLLTAQ